MQSFYNHLQLAIFTLFGVSIFYFFNFTVDDAYIVYRYAENFINIGALVFNEGEPINALTSPLHALTMSVVFYLTGNIIVVNKLLSLALLITSAALVCNQFRKQVALQTLALILILLPSHVLLWTFGGLETIFLLFLVTITTLLVINGAKNKFNLRSLCLVFFIAGLGFLTRYDAVFFFLPVILYAATRSRQIKFIPIAILVGALLPLIWLLISINYYGDLLPTSFYIKTPNLSPRTVSGNSTYIFVNLFYIGILPTIAAILILLLLGHKKKPHHFKTLWWLYLAIVLVILYGLSMALTHMMFSFRFFVPYIPVTALLLLSFMQNPLADDRRRVLIFYKYFLFSLLFFHGYQIYYTYNYSINGMAYLGGYRKFSMVEYFELIKTWKQEAKNTKAHWQSVKQDKNHRPRLATYAEGVVPYYFREAYVYGPLVSYRHGATRIWGKGVPASDYLHDFPKVKYSDIPKNKHVISQIEGPWLRDKYHIFLVFYNDNPVSNKLGATINEPNIESLLSDKLLRNLGASCKGFFSKSCVTHTSRLINSLIQAK